MTGAVYVIGAAGTVALALSATGLYAVLSYIVALRRREIGVRLAIGAPPFRIITLVVRQALTLVLAGMACGLALAVPMASWRPSSRPFVHLESIRSPHCGRNRRVHQS